MRKRATNEDGAPPWLQAMRMINGTKEVPGSGDNPQIIAMADFIASKFTDMESYCAQYQHDDTAWCGLASGACLAFANIRPPFGKTDTDRFLWADSFRTDPNFIHLDSPVLGAIVVMTRSGGNHVTMFERWSGSSLVCRGGNQSDMVCEATYDTDNITGYMWPKDYPMPVVPPTDRPEVEYGDRGSYVVSIQHSLGVYPEDGDFGGITDAAVKGFQAAAGLDADGVVGQNTWAALDSLDKRKAEGVLPLDQSTVDAITQVAETSAIAKYNWRDRGVMPKGFTAGIALCFAYCCQMLADGDEVADELAQKDRGTDSDALHVYRSQFQAAGMSNATDSIDTMRHLFCMLLGLGARESSGRYSEGRDTSVPVGYYGDPDTTTEAAFVQTSWDIAPACDLIEPLLPQFWDNPNGFLPTFQKGVTLKSNDLICYGNEDGVRYQFLAKFAPLLHALVSTLGMRYRANHWGPINRAEVEIRRDADSMLREVQTIMEGGTPNPGPDPEPSDVPVANLSIDPSGGAKVAVFGGASPDAQVPDDGIVPTITVTVDPPGRVVVNVTGSAGGFET